MKTKNKTREAMVAPLTMDFITRVTGMSARQALAAMDKLTSEGLILPQLEGRDVLTDTFDVLVPLQPETQEQIRQGAASTSAAEFSVKGRQG